MVPATPARGPHPAGRPKAPRRCRDQALEPAARGNERVPLNVFLSYSHQDKKAKGTFEQNLTVMMKKRLITPWHDGLLLPGMRWREEIQMGLAKMDIFVALVTTPFLASGFIEQFELKAARDRLRTQGRDFLFVPILVNPVSVAEWDLDGYQLLMPGDKAVSQHRSLRAGFDLVQLELERLIKQRQDAKKREEGSRPPPNETA